MGEKTLLRIGNPPFMLNVKIHPSALDRQYVFCKTPVEYGRPSLLRRSSLLRVLQVLTHSIAQINGQPDVQNVARNGAENIAATLPRHELLMTPPKWLRISGLWNER